MKTVSGFTFVHNAIHSGYPIFEAIHAIRNYVNEVVIVDMESTDKTRELLNRYSEMCFNTKGNLEDEFLGECRCPAINIIDGKWGNQAGETLKEAHSLYKECSGDIILHFEADEVYSKGLLDIIVECIQLDMKNLAVYRLQLEQNFQRCRWYPELVHRVWPRNIDIEKVGCTTNYVKADAISSEFGFLWDITNCFRDNWLNRVKKQAELRDEKDNYVMVPIHTLQESKIRTAYITERLNEPHWIWKATPFDIPDVLRPLLGMTKYDPTV